MLISTFKTLEAQIILILFLIVQREMEGKLDNIVELLGDAAFELEDTAMNMEIGKGNPSSNVRKLHQSAESFAGGITNFAPLFAVPDLVRIIRQMHAAVLEISRLTADPDVPVTKELNDSLSDALDELNEPIQEFLRHFGYPTDVDSDVSDVSD